MPLYHVLNTEDSMAADLVIHSLIILLEYKSALNLDDRDGSFVLFISNAASYSAENYCFRRILRKRHTEYFDTVGDNAFFLREYLIREILIVHEDRVHRFPETSCIDPEPYYCTPEILDAEDLIST